MARAPKSCSHPDGCPRVAAPGGASRCIEHKRAADTARGTSTERGYNTRAHRAFRDAVLTGCGSICQLCQLNLATVADHFPISRRDLVDAGLDPNDPARGRGLCASCHNRHTGLTAGGWANANGH